MSIYRFLDRAAAAMAGSALILSGFAVPASAQQTGTRLGRVVPRTKPDVVFNLMAECFTARHPAMAASYLRQLPGSAEQELAFNAVTGAMEICLNSRDFDFEGGELVTDRDRVHRGLAYFIVRAQAKSLPVTLPGEGMRPWFAAELPSIPESARFALGIEKFGHCVVARNWATARSLVMADPGSKDEKAAQKALLPDMQACVNLGDSLQVDKRLLGHVLGDAMYHVALESARQRIKTSVSGSPPQGEDAT